MWEFNDKNLWIRTENFVPLILSVRTDDPITPETFKSQVSEAKDIHGIVYRFWEASNRGDGPIEEWHAHCRHCLRNLKVEDEPNRSEKR